MKSDIILWGLNENSTNEEIAEKALSLLGEIMCVSVSTVWNGQPEARALEFNRLSDGRLYFIASKGKPTHEQMMANPHVVLTTIPDIGMSIRLNGVVKVHNDPKMRDEFFARNRGTEKMYRTKLDILDLLCVESGEGELFHVIESDRVRRLRFTFGPHAPEKRPMNYHIQPSKCISCGLCRQKCPCDSISSDKDGHYRIKEYECNDCGICYTFCPHKAIACRLDCAADVK